MSSYFGALVNYFYPTKIDYMNNLNIVLSTKNNPNYYYSQLPELGPRQMVAEYFYGCRPIAFDGPVQYRHTIGNEAQFCSDTTICLDSNSNVVVHVPRDNLLHTFQPDGTLIRSIACPNSAKHFAIGKDDESYFPSNGIEVYDRAGVSLAPLNILSTVDSQLAFTDDGSFLLVSPTDDDMQLQFFDPTGSLLATRHVTRADYGYKPSAVAWNPSTRTFAVATYCMSEPTQLHFYRYNENTQKLERDYEQDKAYFELYHGEIDSPIKALSFDAVGNRVVATQNQVNIEANRYFNRQTIPLRASSTAVDLEGRIYIFEAESKRLSVWK